jgi:hypothetical protein
LRFEHFRLLFKDDKFVLVEGFMDDLEVRFRKFIQINTVYGGAEINAAFRAVFHGGDPNIFDDRRHLESSLERVEVLRRSYSLSVFIELRGGSKKITQLLPRARNSRLASTFHCLFEKCSISRVNGQTDSAGFDKELESSFFGHEPVELWRWQVQKGLIRTRPSFSDNNRTVCEWPPFIRGRDYWDIWLKNICSYN